MAAMGWSTLLAGAVCFLALIPLELTARKQAKRDLIENLSDVKEFKKLLRTKTNVLAIFAKSDRGISKQMTLYADVANEIKGTGSLVFVDCSESKKLCKKMKASPSPIELKHYKDGEFNKNYDRRDTVKSMVNFMRDPTGDIPWEEDAAAQDITHVETPAELNRLLQKEKSPLLIMFYAPWCGFCKRLKPDYSAAATELKGEAVLAGMDVDKPENMMVRTEYNITGFPTIFYFEGGKLQYKYGGENNKDGIVTWMRNPEPPKEAAKEAEWSDEEGEVLHLTDATFDDALKEHSSILVMFYAPWCGHCKKMKPDYSEVAQKLKDENIDGVVAAVDATKEKQVAEKFKVQGFPTIKYFQNGEFKFDFNERTQEKILSFMKDPQEPPPPPPPEPAWEEVESEVIHLKEDSFKTVLKKKKHALVMFYAPWCGHCKKAKPEYTGAAEKFKDDNKVAFTAVDCTTQSGVCSAHEVTGYPTFKYFNYGKDAQKYTGGREELDFVNFMRDPLNPLSSAPPAPPSPESQWSDVTGAENVAHLTDQNFNEFIQGKNSVLVMFYAPWCGHCKSMKPAYGEAALKLKEENIDGVLAAVDATAQTTLGSRFNIRGYPSLKYFKNGVELFDYNKGRGVNDLVSFMKSPEKPPAEPPAEPAWSATPSKVNHLTDATYTSFLKEKEHVLVMFYAPWCGHCKRAKPGYQEAAETLAGQPRHMAAVDCTTEKAVCEKEGIKGYPTIKYFVKGKFTSDYNGGRAAEDFVNFLTSPPKGKEEL